MGDGLRSAGSRRFNQTNEAGWLFGLGRKREGGTPGRRKNSRLGRGFNRRRRRCQGRLGYGGRRGAGGYWRGKRRRNSTHFRSGSSQWLGRPGQRLRHGQRGRAALVRDGVGLFLDPAALDENLGVGICHDDARGRNDDASRLRPQFSGGIRVGDGPGDRLCRRRSGSRSGYAERRHRLRGRLGRKKRSRLGRGRRTGQRRSRRLRRLGRFGRRGRLHLGNARHRLRDGGGPGGRCTGCGRGNKLARTVHRKRGGRGDIGPWRRCDLSRGGTKGTRGETYAQGFALRGVWILALGSRRVSHILSFYSYFGKCSMAKFAIVTHL